MKRTSSAPLPAVSLEEVYSVVTAATSQDPTQIKDATDRLKEILERPGALDCLYEIAIQKTVPLQVRQQSIIQFKNNIGHWRSRRYVSDEHRVRIRLRSWAFLDEEDDIVFNCHKVIMAKIARADYPNNWSTLFPDLLNSISQDFESCYGTPIENSPVLRLRRSLQILNAVVKELATLKIGFGLKTFSSITEQLHMVMFSYYSNISPVLTASLTPATLGLPRTAHNLIIGHLVYKCLVKVSAWIWHRIEQEDYTKYQTWFQEFFKSSAFQMQSLFERRVDITSSLLASNCVEVGVLASVDHLTRHIRVFGKFFRRIQQLNNKHFVLLPMCTDIILYYWSKVVQATSISPDFISDSQSAVFPIRFLVQAMVLFRESLAQWTPVRKDGTPNENTLTRDFVEGAVKLLVTRFIPLTPADLDNWMTDPEEWMNREENENDHWEYELRPCAERVLLTLSSQYTEYVAVLLKATFDDVVGRTAVDLPEIIAKEAVYCAVGRCCLRLKDAIPFQHCLEHTFVAEAQNVNQNYPIIKRRIAWLIGKWISDDCSPANNPKIWDILVHLLQDRGAGTDLAVRLTAATALRECIDTVTFDAKSFEPFIATVVPQLLRLIVDVDSLESRRRVINSLNNVIQRSEKRIVPFLDTIAQQIPQLWSNAGDGGEGWLLKGVLVHTVIFSLEACKESSAPLVNLVVPLVRECLSPQASLHLDKDGIILWAAALRNSGPVVQNDNGPSGLFNLLPLLVTILSNNVDLLGSVTDIIESYYILKAEYVLQLCAIELFRAYNEALTHAVPVNNKYLIGSLNLLFQLAPASLWGEPLHVSGLFSSMLNILLEDKHSAILLTEYIYVFSRIALADRQIFLQLMSATAASKNIPESQFWKKLLDQWWTRFDNMSEPRHRKLTAMGLASLVSTGRPEVLDRIPNEISNLWLDVFGEIKEQERLEEEGTGPVLSLYWDQPFSSLHGDIEGTPEHARRNLIFDNDPVRTTQLTSFIQARLGEAQIASGGPQVFQTQYLSKIDPAVLKQIEAALKGQISLS